jgi:hypothetical protein
MAAKEEKRSSLELQSTRQTKATKKTSGKKPQLAWLSDFVF